MSTDQGSARSFSGVGQSCGVPECSAVTGEEPQGYSRMAADTDRLVGLVVKVSASRATGLGFDSRLRRDFSGSSHTGDLKIGTPVATLLGA